ncbi:MAG: DUF2171 domain-containing protein [Leptolyngbyaceae cyanobacterium HOT.MB2.61]|jgi:hypothetical protein|nr:DUF2171 domain-containing protein [Leptolyngbyaceae cyanobacterium HOT.MB2.61]
MVDASQIKEHLMVHAKGMGSMEGSPGVHIGTVDRVEGGKYIRLTQNDSHDGRCHWFPLDWVESVNNEAIYLNKRAEEAMSQLIDQPPADM